MKRRTWLPLMLLFGMAIGVVLLVVVRPAQDEPATPPERPPTLAGTSPSLTPAPARTAAAQEGSAPLVAENTAAPAPSPTPDGPPPTGTPLAVNGYFVTVEAGDTLWNIAIAANFPMEDIIAANPDINPEVLQPGERILIPDPASPFVEVAPGTASTPSPAFVDTGGEPLNLRSEPVDGLNVIDALQPGTSLNVVGRTADNGWLQVITAAGGRGWVMAEFVTLGAEFDAIPVTGPGAPGKVAEVAPTPTTPSGFVPTKTPLSLYPEGVEGATLGQPGDYPYITNITETSRVVFQRGQELGNRPEVFSKVGDSITVAAAFLTPIGRGEVNLREYSYLGPVIDYYGQTVARTENSFANTSLAAKGGWSAWTVLNPSAASPDFCLSGETPLVCEYRLVRPSVALVMLGTNDVTETGFGNYEDWMRQTVEISLDLGVIPVLSTIPEFHRPNVAHRVGNINAIIVRLAYEYDVPLWDYHAALVGLENDGLSSDGVHPSWVPDPPATDFTPESLQYGMTVRNLTALQALDAVWRQVIRENA